MDNYKKMMDTEHREEVEALTNEWTNEQKVIKMINNFLIFYIFFDFLFRFIYLQHKALTLMTADSQNEEVLFSLLYLFI